MNSNNDERAAWLTKSLEDGLNELGSSKNPKSLAESVMRLSNHYVSHPDSTSPWDELWAREALLAYYHPLNFSRALAAASRCPEFLNGLESVFDFGCGSGAASLALRCLHPFRSITLVDTSSKVLTMARRQHESFSSSQENDSTIRVSERSFLSSGFSEVHSSIARTGLALFSYSLTETDGSSSIKNILSKLKTAEYEAIMILEPSTMNDARRLQGLREPLIELGYSIWAPCTHSGPCPLLTRSQTDWCHDRTIPIVPHWFPEIEHHLPIKNPTVTFSYLLARRSPAPLQTDVARVTGDTLDEKGKSRQLVCRNEEREFLSWFPSRMKTAPPELKRGDRIELKNTDIDSVKGSETSRELRVNTHFWDRLIR